MNLLAALVLAASAPSQPAIHALLLNGGDKPAANFQSHFVHLEDMRALLLARGVAPERITIFSGDGSDPSVDQATREVNPHERFWLIENTPVGKSLRPRIELVNSAFAGVKLRAAENDSLQAWFEEARTRIAPGDTLLVFVTDHGTASADPDDGFILLWGETLSVKELRALLARLQPGVRVVMMMSQCYSGAFANAMYAAGDDLPGGNVCGFFSTRRDRPAYGCYPEGRGKDRIGHAFEIIQALGAQSTLDAAHREVLVHDDTPDVPLRTSDLYLERVIAAEARARGVPAPELIDGLLAKAWKDRAAWEPEIRLLDAVGRAFGTASPRRISELDGSSELPELAKQMRTYADRWEDTLGDLSLENIRRYAEASTELSAWLDSKAIEKLDAAQKAALGEKLLPRLEKFAREHPPMWERLSRLHDNAALAAAAAYRLEERAAGSLRLRALLTRIAGQVLLADAATDPRARALDKLRACESVAPGAVPPKAVPRPEPEPLPPFSADLADLRAVLPSWLGIGFRPVPDSFREKEKLGRGAASVQTVFPGSPAQKAGVQQGDVVLGPPGAPFDEPFRVREWTMLSPQNTPLPLDVLRGDSRVTLQVSLAPYPLVWPQVAGPPPVGAQAPSLSGLRKVAGRALPGAGKKQLVFFWATWCGPCKRAVPELLAWSKATGAPVVAVSDEDDGLLRKFLQNRDEPFLPIVATDVLRSSFAAYGVSGTPTFVLVDEKGTIRYRQTGYAEESGLEIDGWKWGRKK